MTATGVGYGKIILFGEHFVVYGIPAIATGISNRAIVDVEKAATFGYNPEVPGVIPENGANAAHAIFDALKTGDGFNIRLYGDLPTFGGLGSSAAFCVALTRALSKELALHLRDDQVNLIAYEGERVFHGNPSGIDNTMATYGGARLFIRGATPAENKFEKLKIGTSFYCVVGVTGISSPTAKMVGEVKKFKEEDPAQFQNLCDAAGDIVKRGQGALASGDLKLLGELMNENHKLLQAIGVSIEKNDAIVNAALGSGALGAKLTGGGGGGCCIALAKDEAHAKKIMQAIKNAGFDGFVTKVEVTA